MLPIMLVFGAIALLAFSKTDAGQAIMTSTGTNWNRFDDLFKKYGEQYGVNWQWLKAISLNESSLGSAPSVARGLVAPTDVEGSASDDGKSWGLMQLTVPTAQEYEEASPEKLNNPDFSIRVSAQFIAWLQKRFPLTDPRYNEWVIKSYNQGAGNTNSERDGRIEGYAAEYWTRFQRNLGRVQGG